MRPHEAFQLQPTLYERSETLRTYPFLHRKSFCGIVSIRRGRLDIRLVHTLFSSVYPRPMYINTAQAAHTLGVSQRRVVDYIHDTRLPAEQVNGRWLIKQGDLQLPAVCHRSPGGPPGRKSSCSPLSYQPTPRYMRDYILQRDGLVCQLCLRNDQDILDHNITDNYWLSTLADKACCQDSLKKHFLKKNPLNAHAILNQLPPTGKKLWHTGSIQRSVVLRQLVRTTCFICQR